MMYITKTKILFDLFFRNGISYRHHIDIIKIVKEDKLNNENYYDKKEIIILQCPNNQGL